MNTSTPHVALGALAMLLGGAACDINVNLVGKACSADGRCPAGLICEPSSRLCLETAGVGGAMTGSGGTGGMGASGGSTGEVRAADWTGSMVALYTFDDPVAVGQDATAGSRDLTPIGAPIVLLDDPMQGAGYVSVDTAAGSRLEIVDTVFASTINTSFTYGGWFRVGAGSGDSPSLIRRRATAQGYFLEWAADTQQLSCQVGAGGGHGGPSGSAQLGEWIHIACRYEAFLEILTAVQDGDAPPDDQGTSIPPQNIGNPPDATPLSLSAAVGGLTGDIDEVFFINKDLTTPSIRRIFACGVDGKRCLCDPDDNARYLDCGAVAVCDSDLPPCDTPTPKIKSDP